VEGDVVRFERETLWSGDLLWDTSNRCRFICELPTARAEGPVFSTAA
jgi:hypothetical protein